MYKHMGTQCHAHTPIYLTQYICIYACHFERLFPLDFQCHFKSQKPIAMANGGVRLDRILVYSDPGSLSAPQWVNTPKNHIQLKAQNGPGKIPQTSQFWWRNLKTPQNGNTTC